MGATFKANCPACGNGHDFYYSHGDLIDPQFEYAGECPVKKKTVSVSSDDWNKVTPAKPAGAILVQKSALRKP